MKLPVSRHPKQRRDPSAVPFSWSLLFIALLHFSVWSLGVCEAPARDFFDRQQSSLKAGFHDHQSNFYIHEQDPQAITTAIHKVARSAEDRQRSSIGSQAHALENRQQLLSSTPHLILVFITLLTSSIDTESTGANQLNYGVRGCSLIYQ